MMTRIRLIILIVLLLVMVGILFYLWNRPRLLAMYPPNGALDVPANTGISLSFSRPMQESSVLERITIEPATDGVFSWQGNMLIFTPQKPWPAGSTVQVNLDAGARTKTWPSLALSQQTRFSFVVRQPRLLYLYPTQEPASIYTWDPGSNTSQLAADIVGAIQDFTISADGDMLYYSVRQGQQGSAIYRLELSNSTQASDPTMTMQESQGQPQLILECPSASCRAPVISPDHRYLAFERIALPESGEPNIPQVWWLALPEANLPPEGVSFSEARRAGDPAHQTLQPSWSSEGVLAFYDTQAAAYIFITPQGGEVARFANETGQPGKWHPTLAYYLAPEIIFLDANISESVVGLNRLSASHLMLFDLKQNQSQDISQGMHWEDTDPVFSPDGDRLVFARKSLDINAWTPGRQIWLMSFGSNISKPLTNEPDYTHFNFAWSPDGKMLAYMRFNQSALSEPPELWMMNLETGQAIQLLVGAYGPAWVP